MAGSKKEKHQWLKKGYLWFVKGENFVRHFLLLGVRVHWGILLMITGLGKFINGQSVSDYFHALNIPYPLFSAYLVSCIEFFGGLSLIVGFLSRLSSFLLTLLFVVAYSTAHRAIFHHELQNIFHEFIAQESFLYLFASLIVLSFGPGLFSFDSWVEKKIYGKTL